MKKLDKAAFLEVVKNTPLVAIDLLVCNPAGEVLLGHRVNKPAQHSWFVPGGKIMKDETLSQAFQRLAKVELGLDLQISIAPGGKPTLIVPDSFVNTIMFKGIYEHLYSDNFASVEGITTHYITLAYVVELSRPLTDLPPDQHSAFKWWRVADLLNSPDVHENSKAYFK